MRLLIALALPGAIWACSCGVSPLGVAPCQSAWTHSAVFTGMVTRIEDPESPMAYDPARPFPQRKAYFAVTEAFTGLAPSTKEIVVETGMGGGDCGYRFQRGHDYIVYLSRNANGAYYTGICSPTRPLADAAEDLKYFHGLADAPSVGEIRVLAFDAQRSGGTMNRAGARVGIDGPGGRFSGITGADGRYTFRNLAPGEYAASASLEGYVPFTQPRPIKVPAKGCAQALLTLILDRAVTGNVTTADGKPAAGIEIEAVPQRPRHQNDLPMAADSATTDADGRYSLRNLPAGDYYLGISISRTPTTARPYTRWFYPGTEDPGPAAIVHVADRPGTQSFNLIAPPPQHQRVIEGTVYWADGTPASGANLTLEDPRWSWQTPTSVGVTDSQGHFSISALDGTRYRLHAATFRNRANPMSAEPVPIEPGRAVLQLKLVLTQKGYSPMNLTHTGLDQWRKGLGLQ